MKEGILVSSLLAGVLTLILFTDVTRSESLEKCQPRNVSYNIGDTEQCDKFWTCTKGGKLLERLCDDGFVHSIEIAQCDYPHNVDCSARPALQPTKSTHPDCPRSNGFYAFPAANSCQKFFHCLEGQAYEKTCPAGVIFDPTKGTCTHPDLTRREDCSAKEVHNFTCPNAERRFTKLRFGDHDRFHHPSDCRMFFICLKDGRPRLGGCPLGKVFNEKTGFCDAPSAVPQCNDYYGKHNITQLLEQSESLDFVFGDPNANANNEIDNFPNLSVSLHKKNHQEEIKPTKAKRDVGAPSATPV